MTSRTSRASRAPTTRPGTDPATRTEGLSTITAAEHRALVIQNSKTSGLRRLGDWLAEDGLRVDLVEAYDGAALPESTDGAAALVLLGGGLMPDADEKAPWLAQERVLARAALESGVPLLGICLGGQLLAHIAGGEVKPDHGLPESGSTALTLRPEAADDPLFRELPEVVTGMEHHVDAITGLPATAVWLAQSDRCPYQAFRIEGAPAWGFQFHPEADAAGVRKWDRDRLREQGFDPDEVVRQAEADEPAAVAVWREIARRFAEIATSRHAG
ncbi:type 1 glutamine amidotransferase [Segeticoccus rhizosphaerae]|uniref:type 1 glutamine amidotransferase n=1 Tax=Segeticoccus rhizosphaerae TaxID=1104777 RepID=UPI00193A6B01|nr:type 1 glutamine amidotransferase [Segeticoccus rhizosphaerae]